MSDLSEDPFAVAKNRGLDCILPGDFELFLDLDDFAAETAMRNGIEVLRNNGFAAVVTKMTQSPGGNKHAYVEIKADKPLTPLERVCLQSLLGSDRKRETLAYLRIAFNVPVPASCFFENKEPKVLWTPKCEPSPFEKLGSCYQKHES